MLRITRIILLLQLAHCLANESEALASTVLKLGSPVLERVHLQTLKPNGRAASNMHRCCSCVMLRYKIRLYKKRQNMNWLSDCDVIIAAVNVSQKQRTQIASRRRYVSLIIMRTTRWNVGIVHC